MIHEITIPTPWDRGGVHVYVIKDDPLTLIDTGVKTPAARAALETAFDRLDLCLEDVQRVVLTHYHRDHLGQVQSLRDLGAKLEVWAHGADAPMIENYRLDLQENIGGIDELFREYGVPADVLDRHNRWRREEIHRWGECCDPTRVDHIVRNGDAIPFKDFELEVIHAPGHTAGHILLHEEKTGALFTGDHILGDSVPFTETYYTDEQPDLHDSARRRPRFQGLPEYIRSLRSLRQRSFRRLLPSQGGLLGRPDRLIENSLLFYDVRVQRIERGLRTLAAMDQEVTAWEIWRALFPKVDPVTDLRSSMLMVIGVLDVLEVEGHCLTSRRTDGALFHEYRKA